jgi:IS605 OrfB family transposase
MATEEIIKANFMYGYPNKGKYDMIAQTQSAYLKSINNFINIMKSDTTCYLSIFNLDTKSKIIVNIEKLNRDKFLGSAYSQKASHVALDKLHTTFDKIKRDMYGYAKNKNEALLPFISSVTVLNACLTGQNTILVLKEAIIREYDCLMNRQEKTRIKHVKEHGEEPEFKIVAKPQTLKLYEELYIVLKSMDTLTRELLEEEARAEFFERLEYAKTPKVIFSPIPLDSRTCKIVNVTEDLKEFDYILEVTVAKGIDSKGRVAIPFKTSKHCLLRMNKYENCKPSICIDKTGKVKLSLPIKKEITAPTTNDKSIILGTDLGIVKIFSLNTGINFGTFRGMTSKYSELVEKQLGNRSSLRHIMRGYQKELKSKNISEDRKVFLRSKIFNIAKNLQGSKRLTKSRNRYKYSTNKSISVAIKGLLKHLLPIKSKVLVVLEKLDITNFNLGTESNKRNSMWSRGQIIDKLTKVLKWHGIAFDFVDPAYTSQQCPICHNIDKSSRKGEVFRCTCCGHIADADNNAGINIASRYHDEEISSVVSLYSWNTKKRHEAIREIFNNRNQSFKIANNIA